MIYELPRHRCHHHVVPSKLSPAARMAAVLSLLQGAGTDHLLASNELWAAIPDYADGEPSGRRQYRRDLHALKARGLVQTDVTTERTPRRTGVRLRFIGKPKDWELTDTEHVALRAARSGHRGTAPLQVTQGRDEHGSALDLAMDALRPLEEHGEWMTCGALAVELARPPAVILAALRELFTLDIEGRSLFDGVLLIEEFDEDSDERLPAEQVLMLAERNPTSTKHPLRGYGLDTLGRFAYTAAETAEALRIIDAELASLASADEADDLRTARRKLGNWAEHLNAAKVESGTAS